VNNWTPDRPTKPGKYWLSVAIPDRERFACAVCREVQHVYTIEVVEEGCGLWLDGVIDVGYCLPESAKFLPYVEPPDPFAEPVPVEMYRMSDDAKTPNLRLILSVEPGEVVLYEADMTSRSATAKETAVYDKIIMSPADARWLRDALRQVDLSDPPEVTSTEPVPSLRERVEGLPTYDIDGEVWSLSVREVPGGEYLKRSEVLVLVDEVTR